MVFSDEIVVFEDIECLKVSDVKVVMVVMECDVGLLR